MTEMHCWRVKYRIIYPDGSRQAEVWETLFVMPDKACLQDIRWAVGSRLASEANPWPVPFLDDVLHAEWLGRIWEGVVEGKEKPCKTS